MVSTEIFSTKPSSTTLSASKRTVQWSCPSGAGLQATAIRWAVCRPDSALRRCCWTCSCKTASNPPWAKRRRTLATVAWHTSRASARAAVLQPWADLSRMRARVSVRALALPRRTKVSRVVRSSSVKVTAGGYGIASSPDLTNISAGDWTTARIARIAQERHLRQARLSRFVLLWMRPPLCWWWVGD